MLAAERRARITKELRVAMTVSTDRLAEILDVSNETIRRDLAFLEARGLLTRVYGGASAGAMSESGQEANFADRALSAHEAKLRIGAKAASLIKSGQTVIIDLGTTAICIARAIPFDLVATVITNSLLVAAELADRPNLEILVSGGRLRGGDMALSNSITLEFFNNVRADIAFISCGGVDAEGGLSDYYLEESAVKRVIIKNSLQSFAIADSSKFGHVARHRVVNLEKLTGLITDSEPPQVIASALQQSGGRIELG